LNAAARVCEARRVRGLACLSLLLVAGVSAPVAGASQIVSTSGVTGLRFELNAKGEALLTYRSRGKLVRVLAWGAVNANPSTSPDAKQVAFRLDYSGGWAKYFRDDPSTRRLVAQYRRIKGTPGYLRSPVVRELQARQQAASNYWRTGFSGYCGRYDGPPLPWLTVACKAPDGSYWAVQRWPRKLPNYGLPASGLEAALEVHLSHWRGELPVLTVAMDWSWRRWEHLYGTLTYRGLPVHGFASTSDGRPLDRYGRNIYVDTYDSAYGPGWRRENSFLSHRGTGAFCYSFNPHGPRPAGKGTRYRATVMGPGVTPVLLWTGTSPGPFDAAADAKANAAIAALGDPLCRPN
jgi:hypothetical protein